MRPGYKEYKINDIDVKTFDIDAEIEILRFKVKAPWNGSLSLKEYGEANKSVHSGTNSV